MILASFVEVLKTSGYIVVALLFIMLMIVVHELGHYLAGKALGFKILEFGIGFGPPIYKRKSKKTGEIFSIRPIPLGGFCQFDGEDSGDSTGKGSFNRQHPFKRIIVLSSGALFNFVFGLILIIILFSVFGQMLPSVNMVFEDSKNVNTLKSGDVFLKVNNKQVNILTQDDLNRHFQSDSNEINVLVLRYGKKQELKLIKGEYLSRSFDENGEIIIDKDENGQAIKIVGFGFNMAIKQQKLPFLMSISRGFYFVFFVVYKLFITIGGLFSGKIPFAGGVGGPVTTISLMAQAGKASFSSLFYIVCLLSANLAVLNILPIPALDGSKIVFTIIEWIFKKPLNKKFEAAITILGLIFLLGIAILADIMQLRL